MNRTLITNPAFSNSPLHNGEVLAMIHESAKQRAQALRREAVSSLIDDVIAWVLRKPVAQRNAVATQTHCASCAH